MFTDDLLPLAVEDANSVRQSTLKRYFIGENSFFKNDLVLENQVIGRK